MASEIEQAQNEYELAKSALDRGDSSYTYKGKKYTLTKLRDELVPQLKKAYDAAKKQGSMQATAEWVAGGEQRAAQDAFDLGAQDFQKGKIDEAQLNVLRTALSRANANLEAIKNGRPAKVSVDPDTGRYKTEFVAETRDVAATPAAPTEPKAPTLGPSPIEVKAKTPTETTEPPPPSALPTPSPSGPGKPAPTQWVDTQLELRSLPDTPKNRKLLQQEYGKTKFKPLNPNWIEEFNAKFPTLGFIFTNPEFGPEVIDIARRAIEQQWYLYPETASQIIAREIANTPYGQRSSALQESFDKKDKADQQIEIERQIADLQKTYGKLDLSSADWQTIGYTAARNGLDSTITQQKMLQFVYQKTPEGALRYENSVKQLEAGKLGQDVRKVYADYMITADSDSIKNYATGQTTLEDIRRQARELAKRMYPALADLLDQGLSVKSVADQYGAYAADTLELAPGSVNMMDPKFRIAFDVREGDKSRTMSIGEWQTLLKTDPNYGWQYTKQANQQALDLATTIARAFGKVG